MTTLAWHYTNGLRFPQILESGRLQLETGPVSPRERRAHWFTLAETYEPTCYKRIGGRLICDPEELAEALGGLYRFGVARSLPALRTVRQWRRESGCPPEVQRQLIDLTAVQHRINPYRDWRMSFRPVNACDWLAVEESLNGRDWQPVPGFRPCATAGAGPKSALDQINTCMEMNL